MEVEQFIRLVESITRSAEQRVASRSRTFVPPHSMMAVPSYDPSDSTADITKYINNPEQLSRMYGWDEPTLIFVATSNLKGHARKWY